MKKVILRFNLCMIILMLLTGCLWAGTFSYTQDFSGSNGAQPVNWVVGYGSLSIQNNTYKAPSTDTEHLSYYNGAGSNLWSNYTASLWVYKTTSWTTNAKIDFLDTTGIAFRVQNSNNYYFAALRKLAHMYDGRLCIYKVTPEGSDLIGSVKSRYPLNSYYQDAWFKITVELNGNQITARFVEQGYEWDIIGEVTVTDDSYSNGTAGIYSISVNDGAGGYHSADDLTVNGTTIENCDDVVAQYSPAGDFNNDCRVDFKDAASLANSWLNCILPGNQECSTPWNN
ncbi:MAG: hypothetical protein A2Y10_05615 [Planctomycetes bacterium GWF2_41_51]|nr:MAG: hypothetical protein A2Y10_05615 [Planctomycetes bacterium GWF2_41_51]